ncbi:MAG TPA: YciI family protein [Gemmatimonas sp.]|nr:YciI family protein [Gemmatimonas sp.]
MKYMMMFAEPEHHIAQRTSADAPAYWAAWGAFAKSMAESGLMISGHGLQDKTTATTVRITNGKRIVQDGPFADAKEQLAGYFVLEVPNIDMVLEWAAKVPGVDSGTVVEIRPILTMQ